MDPEALSARLLSIFVEELDEHVQAMNSDLLALEADPGDAERLRSLFRTAHTLKGAARAVAAGEVESACHAAEELLAAARDGRRALEPPTIELLLSFADALADAAARLREGRPLADGPLAELSLRFADPERPAPTPPMRPPAGTPPPAPPPAAPLPPPAETPPAEPPPAEAEAPGAGTPPTREPVAVRVSAERLDDLLASAGEVVALGRRSLARASELRELDGSLTRFGAEWNRQAIRMRRAASAADAGGESARAIGMVDEQLRQLADRVRRLARDASGDARTLDRTAGVLLDSVHRLRMRPVQEALDGLPRTVRDLAATAGKEVRLEIEDGGVEVDRTVLEALRDAVLPVVRNAVDHGLEAPQERVRAGKPPHGTVRVAAALQGDRVVVTIADDGAGLDAPRLRARLAASGADVPPDDAGLGRLILGGGVSSRASASRISGRGVGLDIVRAAMERVRGRVTLRWEAGRGTQVRLAFPPSLASLRALLVGVGAEVLAVPTLAVERVTRLRADAIRSLQGRPVLGTSEGPVPLVSLARVLGPPLVERPLGAIVQVVLLAAQGERVALVVDDLLAEEELVIRPLHTGRVALPLIAGAATLASGGVAPLLDAPAVVAAALSSGGVAVPLAERPGGPRTRRVLVADDSLTTRTLERSVLEAAGYEVLTAVDGLDAWRVLQEEAIDLLVSDVEMPRMDGFRLCETVRGAARLKQLPVVLVTARESAEDRARGLEAGADAYLPKSSFEQEHLLETVRQLLE